MICFKSFLLLFCFHASVWGAIQSTSGEIEFDVNADDQAELTLNATGLGVGTSSPGSSLELQGSLGLNHQVVSSNVTLSANTLVLVDTSAANLTLSLPQASSVEGRTYWIKKISNDQQLWLRAEEAIDGESSAYLLSESFRGRPFIWVYSDGSEWHMLNASESVEWVVGSDNLVSWWKLEDESGTDSVDVTPNQHDLTLNNGLTFSGCLTTGYLSGALSFDGSNDYATTSSEINATIQSEVTIAGWMKASGSSFDNFAMMMTEGYLGDGNVGFSLGGRIQGGSATKVGAGFYNGSWHTVNQTGSFTFGEWVHLAATYDGAELKLYIDGELDNTSADAAGLPSGSEEWRIGRRHDGTNYFEGELDDLRLYNRALTATEISAIYRQAKAQN